MITLLERVQNDPRVRPTFIPALQQIQSLAIRVEIRKAIQRVCKSGRVSQDQLQDEIAEIICEGHLAEERNQINVLTYLVPHIRDLQTHYEKEMELKHLRLDVNSSELQAEAIVSQLLASYYLIVTGSNVVVCAEFPLQPAQPE